MQHDQNKQAYPILFDIDKKQRFGVSDNGEFIDTVYREQESNKFFGKLIGRNYVQPNSKKIFTTSDIVAESYLHKKGSWKKNWKKRYFILRKDIRSLCYYHSREDLTLLGTIPLDIDTQLSNVKQEDADGFEHCIAMQTEQDNGANSVTYIRFDTFEKMKSWMIDIKNEAHSMKPTCEETSDWWSALFDQVLPVTIKSNAMRRDGQSADIDYSKIQLSEGKVVSLNAKFEHSSDIGGSNFSSLSNNSKLTSGESVISASADPTVDNLPVIHALKLAASMDSDNDSEGEDNKANSPSDFNKQIANRMDTKLSPIRPTTSITVLKPTSKKVKSMKSEKPSGPPPFDDPTVDRFETVNGALSGYQLSLRLCNVCGYQDKIFIVVFGSVASDKKISAVTIDSKVTSGSLNSGSKWTQLSRTELRMVTDKPEYGENYVNDFKIHFSVLEDLIPESCKDIKISVYRQENEMNPREPAKATNLNMQLEMARTIISRKLFVEMKSVLKITMQVKIELPMDIAIPLFKESEVTLGVVRLSSYALHQHRSSFISAMKCQPYAELLYSFCTNSGQTLSLEQLFASRISIGVAQALLSLWHQERYDYMSETLQMLREEFAMSLKDQEIKIRSNLQGGETLEEKIGILFEPFRQAIEVIDEVFNSSIENTSMVLANCDNACKGEKLINNVLNAKVGGGVLRRSVWKKITAWQYCTTNLNVHLVTSKHFTFSDLMLGCESGSGLHYIPSITLGVPAAHELKFHDGGLRKIFGEVSEIDQKLRWMQAFQSPNLEGLKALFTSHPKEAQSLFGIRYLMVSKEDLASVFKRKFELAKRIDICGSQALGCAITSIKTICVLASQVDGRKYMDILARSLKIGFLVMFESMLSTQGDELGMIEDMDMAVLWLSLVTLRLVTTPKCLKDLSCTLNEQNLHNDVESKSSKIFTTEGKAIYTGAGDSITCRRDSSGKLVVDLEIQPNEAAAVMDAYNLMNNFELSPPNFKMDPTVGFSPYPVVCYGQTEVQPKVYAVVEIFGVAFNQGVNEMQTLANLSSSRDVTRQVEINYGSLSRFVEFYRCYKSALEFQLVKRTPELLEILNNNALIASNSNGGINPHTNRTSISIRRRKSLRNSVNVGLFGKDSGESFCSAADALKAKVLNANDRMMDQVHDAIASSTATPHEKHIDVLLKTSALCREIGGCVGILCKSGKDRTSMGVTLENSRSLVEDLGVLNGQDICQTMRQQGVRRMNVYANTGQCMFAFNQIQRIALPNCFRPPPGSHAGNVTS